jgi:hypothetical protein
LSGTESHWHRLFWLATAAGLLSLIWVAASNLGMQEAPLNFRYVKSAVPTAISYLRGRKHDYAAYMEVAAPFIYEAGGPDQRVNIEKALSVEIRDPDNLWFIISGDDKGLIDLVYLGFALFGPTAASIFKMAAVLFTISVFLYAAEFYDRGPRMALLVSLLASLYAVLFTFDITDQSVSPLEPRFLGFLSAASLLHLLLLVFDGKPLSKASTALAAAQALLLVFVLHLRSSELWQYLCIAGVFFITSVVRRRRLTFANMLVPSLVLFTFLGMRFYQNMTYHTHYLEKDISTHILWHNVLMGLAANPALRERYGLNVLDDPAVMKAVERYLQSTRQTEVREVLFTNQNWADGQYKGFHWSIYESAARALYARIWKESPGEVLKTYIVLMPKTFIANVYYMATGRQVLSEFLFPVGHISTFETRVTKDLYLSPFRLAAVAALLIAAVLLAIGRRSIVDTGCIVASAAAAVASAIPPFLVTPVMHYDQLTIMMMLTLVYVIATVLLASAIRLLTNLFIRGSAPHYDLPA